MTQRALQHRFELMTQQLAGQRPPELPDAQGARVHVAQDEPDQLTVGHCAAAGCRRLSLRWLCEVHRRRPVMRTTHIGGHK